MRITNAKERVKLYKSKKKWVAATIFTVTLGITGVATAGSVSANSSVASSSSQANSSVISGNSSSSNKVVLSSNSSSKLKMGSSTANVSSASSKLNEKSSSQSESVVSSSNLQKSNLSNSETSKESNQNTVQENNSQTQSSKQNLKGNGNFSSKKSENYVGNAVDRNKYENSFAATSQTNNDSDVQIEVSNYDFEKYMHVNGDATYDSATNTVTLTPDLNNQAGHAAMNVQIDMSKDFSINAHVFLGNNPSNKGGADGIAIGFHPGSVNEIGQPGNAFGIGGISNAFGFKLDTFYNAEGSSSAVEANADPSQFSTPGAAFGGFIYSDSNGIVSTYDPSGDSASPATIPSPDGTWGWLSANYNGTTHDMTVTYSDGSYKHTWETDVSKWISSPYMSFVVSSSTGGDKNLQQMSFFNMNASVPKSQMAAYSENVEVKYVNALTGEEIAPSQNVQAYIGQSYTTNELTIPHYSFSKMGNNSAPASGKCTGDGMVVVYEYNPNPEHAVVNYVDSATGKVVASQTVDGTFGGSVTYDPTNTENQLKGKGYVIGSNNLPAGNKITFSQDGQVSTYTVNVSEGTTTYTPSNNPEGLELTHTVNQTIHYVYSNGKQAAPDATAQVTFQRNATKNDITGEITYTDWTPASQEFPAVTSPEITGYTPNAKESMVIGVNGNSEDNVQTITYTANPEHAVVNYVDSATGKVVASQTVDGTFGGSVTYDPTNTENQLKGKGYVIGSNNLPAGNKITFSQDGQVSTYTVNVSEGTTTYTPSNNPEGLELTHTVNQTIHYVNSDGKRLAPSVTQTVTFQRSATVNNVTGKLLYGNWQLIGSDKFNAVVSPSIKGYVTTQTVIDAEDNISINSIDQIVNVVYAASKPAELTSQPSKPDKKVQAPTQVQKLPVRVQTINKISKTVTQPSKNALPQTGEKYEKQNLWGSLLIGLSGILSLLGLSDRKEKR